MNGESLRPLGAHLFEQRNGGGLANGGGNVSNGGGGSVSNGGTSGKYSDMARCALSHPVLPSASAASASSEAAGFGSHPRIYERRRHRHHHQHHQHQHHHHHHQHRRPSAHSGAGVMFRKDILYGGSLQNIPEYKLVVSLFFFSLSMRLPAI